MISLPGLIFSPVLIFNMNSSMPEIVIFDFMKQASIANWNTVNDDVMGGCSESTMQWKTGGTAIFSGRVSLENNGGFAAANANIPALNLADYQGIALKYRGDGKMYKFRIRTKATFDAVTYSNDFFAPDGKWTEVRLLFSDFIPTFRGQIVPHAGPLKRDEIKQAGLLISDKQEGSFALELAWIKSFY